jgi:hypothetical protein
MVKTAQWNFLKLWQIMYLDITIQWCKNIHIDIIAPNFTNFYSLIFKIFKIMFFMDGTQKKWNCEGKLLHTRPLLYLYLWDKKLVTNNPISTVLHVIISKQDIHICQIFHNYSTMTLPSVLKPKYSLSTRNKCVYLLEASETSITIWHQ